MSDRNKESVDYAQANSLDDEVVHLYHLVAKATSAIPYLFILMRLLTLKSRMPLIGARRMREIAS